jgi:hypothetical protein
MGSEMAIDPTQSGIPVRINADGHGVLLDRVPLSPAGKGRFDEKWLQQLVHNTPSCLPIAEIDAGLGRFVSICQEVPTPHGLVDNLLMTPNGDIAMVETKLYRNPEARRQVLAQALDYAVCLFQMDFGTFEQTILRGVFGPGQRPTSLYGALPAAELPPEEAFVDTVVGNLRRGRALIIVAGDGIRSEAQLLLTGLQDYAQFQFTLALVELSVFSVPGTGGFIVRPRTLAKTEIVKRHVFEVTVSDSSIRVRTPTVSEQSTTLSSETFWDRLERIVPGSRTALERLLASVKPIGVFPDVLAGLNLKWERPASGKNVNLGIISKDGLIDTGTASWLTPKELAENYVREVASIFDCEVHFDKNGDYPTLYCGGKPLRLETVLDRLDRWVGPMEHFIKELLKYDEAEVRS